RTSPIGAERVDHFILVMRRERVLLDAALAALYGVAARVQAKSRAFPAGFHVRTLGRRMGDFEIPFCDLNAPSGRSALCHVRVYRARCSDLSSELKRPFPAQPAIRNGWQRRSP